MSGQDPPRLARAIILAMTPPALRGQVEGDLQENFAWQCEENGLRSARSWYWGQLRSADLWRLRRIRGATPGRTRPRRWLIGAGSDLRGALRAWRRQPLHAGAVVATLGIGIGSTSAIFAVVNAVLLRPLPYPEPDRLAMVFRTVPRFGFTHSTASYPDYRDWQAQSQSFSDMAAYAFVYRTHVDGEGAERWTGYQVTANLFPLLGTAAALGRTFSPDDDRPAADPTVVLSHGVWSSRFGSDSGIVGRSIILDGLQHTVIGVMPAAFDFPSRNTGFWVPLRQDPTRAERDANFLTVLGRLRPGVTVERAGDELAQVVARIDRGAPDANEGYGVLVEGRHAFVVRNMRAALWTFLGAVTLVLVIAIVNVANLTLARGTARGRELAVRAALGADRVRLFRQLLTESTLLGVLGGTVGAAVAWGLVRVLVALSPAALPRIDEVGVDGTVLLVIAMLAIGSGIACGVVPALFASGRSAQESLRDGGHATGLGVWGRRVQQVLVVGEIALAMALTVGAGLLIVSFARLTAVNPGFDPDNLVAGRVAWPRPELPADATPADFMEAVQRQQQFFAGLLEGTQGLPGVRDAALAYGLPLTASSFGRPVEVEGALPADGEIPVINGNVVLGNYFRTMGIPLLRGRGFTDADTPNAPPVMVVSETMADALWPDADALGQRVRVGNGEDRPWVTVIGVVGDVQSRSLAEEREPLYYRPLTQALWPSSMYAVVRSGVSPTQLVPAIRQRVQALSPVIPLTDVTSADELLADSVAAPRYRTLVLGAFGGLALALAVVGIYGVIALFVGDRTREIGIRMALGAGRVRVMEMILRQGLVLAAVGIALGIAAAAALTGALSGMLFGLSPLDPMVYSAAATVLLVVAAAACYLPARRAARIDPIESVRYD